MKKKKMNNELIYQIIVYFIISEMYSTVLQLIYVFNFKSNGKMFWACTGMFVRGWDVAVLLNRS